MLQATTPIRDVIVWKTNQMSVPTAVKKEAWI